MLTDPSSKDCDPSLRGCVDIFSINMLALHEFFVFCSFRMFTKYDHGCLCDRYFISSICQHDSNTCLFPCQERQRDSSLDKPGALPESIFYRPVRDGRFFGWAHSGLTTKGTTFTLKESEVILQEAAASEDPPRWVWCLLYNTFP